MAIDTTEIYRKFEEEFDDDKDRLALLMLSRFLKLKDVSYTGTGYSSDGFKELMKLDVKISGLVKKKKIINKDEPNFRRTIEGYVAVPGKEYKIKVRVEEVIKKLNISPIELVRTKESIWIENFKGKQLSDSEIIQAMLENPKLIERPIIVIGNKAVIARPKEKINEIL